MIPVPTVVNSPVLYSKLIHNLKNFIILRLFKTSSFKNTKPFLSLFSRLETSQDPSSHSSYHSENWNIVTWKTNVKILTASQGAPSLPRLFLLQLFRYVLILFLALSANSGNCLVQLSMIACIFSFGCFEMGTIRSKFSSTNSLTNICKDGTRVHRPRRGTNWNERAPAPSWLDAGIKDFAVWWGRAIVY